MTAAVRFKNVMMQYGDNRVLHDTTCDIPQGKITAFLGPSGTGKSTLIRLAIGLEKPTGGTIEVLGHELGGLREVELLRLRQRFGMLFQDGALFGSISVEANLKFPLTHVAGFSSAKASQRAEELLHLVGLPGFGSRNPAQLSGGQRKRVALARAIALEPEIVFLDEPTSGLDPQTSAAMNELLLSMHERLGLTFVVITHDVHSAKTIAETIGFLVGGRLTHFGPQAEVYNSDDPSIRQFLDRVPNMEINEHS